MSPAVSASKAGAAVLGLAGLGIVGYMLTRQDEQYGGGAAAWSPASPSIVTPWKDLLDPGGVTFPTPDDAGGVSLFFPMLQGAPAPVDYSGVSDDKKGTVLLNDFLNDPDPTAAPPLPSLPTLPDGSGGLLGLLAAIITPGVPLIGSAMLAGQAAGGYVGRQLLQPQQPGAGAVNLDSIMQPGTGSLYLWGQQPDGGFVSLGSQDISKKGTVTTTGGGTAAPSITIPGATVYESPQAASAASAYAPEVASFGSSGSKSTGQTVVKKGQIVGASSRPLDSYDVSRLSAKTKAAMGY